MAKFYIAGKFQDKERVQKVQEEIQSNGHEITHDWTQHDPVKPYREKLEKARKYASKDIEGVREADIFVMIPHSGGRTLHAELGAAIVLNSVRNGPDVYLLGRPDDPGMIYFHPVVDTVTSIEEILKRVDGI